ncbi:hypothetical protein B0H63DRAFT_391543 [Podospora didyma]|uniref:Large ribosomal subunit protein bL28m n=1 Tax=Podospora didyma TaxID=330526 RepID=A0AAE0NS74_9PEZI|nr:hypothetical protein B0H63DRAFT_391543 [Podospora didyma]
MAPTLLRPCVRAAASTTTSNTFLNTTRRTLSTSSSLLYKQQRVPGSSLKIPSVTGPALEIPPYPFGPNQVYHQSNTGLYGGQRIRFGNNVSKQNEIKTRRNWRPNVHHKRLWSVSLRTFVRTRLTTRVLRTIDKVGGLDAYLLGIKPARVRELGPWGWRLRWRVMQTPIIRKQFAEQRAALGLPPKAEGEDVVLAGEMADQKLMEETSRMLANEEEFTIGEESDFAAEDAEVAAQQQQAKTATPEVPVEEFMRDEGPRKEV